MNENTLLEAVRHLDYLATASGDAKLNRAAIATTLKDVVEKTASQYETLMTLLTTASKLTRCGSIAYAGDRERQKQDDREWKDFDAALDEARPLLEQDPTTPDPSERCTYKFPGGSVECDIRFDTHDRMLHSFKPRKSS